MKRTAEHRKRDILLPGYDFASMKGGVRGKHLEEYRRGTNVVVLKPDVAEAFPTEDAVNQALRGILSTAQAVRRTGGLSDRALQSGSSAPKRRRQR
jgi:hypothetical protein